MTPASWLSSTPFVVLLHQSLSACAVINRGCSSVTMNQHHFAMSTASRDAAIRHFFAFDL